MPAIATVALGIALLVPLRDDRRGRRATLDGDTPLRPKFENEERPRKPAPQPPPDLFTLFNYVMRYVRPPAAERPPRKQSMPQPESSAAPEAAGAAQALAALQRPGAATAFPESEEWWRAEERSFAAELAALVGDRMTGDLCCNGSSFSATPSEAAASPVSATEAFAAAAASPAEPPVTSDGTSEAAVQSALESVTRDGVASGPTTIESETAQIPASGHASEEPVEFGSSTRHSAADLANGAGGEPLVIHPLRAPVERFVPITRLPLRPQSAAIEWPQHFPGASGSSSVEDRHALLCELATHAPTPQWRAILEQAYREEAAEGRILALRALLRGRYDARDTFVDALHAGTDEERSLSVDALLGLGLRDELVPAFSDRVEAIAAKAALGYVGTNERQDYRTVLERYVDAGRCDAVLGLLAGVLT